MATGKRTSRQSGTKSGHKRSNTSRKKTTNRYEEPLDNSLINEIVIILVFALCAFLFLCNFGIVGSFGKILSDIQFGLFGWLAYITPILFFIALAFGTVNQGSGAAKRKLIAGIVLYFLIDMICELAAGRVFGMEAFQAGEFYTYAAKEHKGGGIFAGMLTYGCFKYLSMVGTILLILVLGMICVVLLTEKSLIKGAKESGKNIARASREDNMRRTMAYRDKREEARARREQIATEREEKNKQRRQEREDREEKRRLEQEAEEADKILRMDKKSRGVMVDTSLLEKENNTAKKRDDMHEITIDGMEEYIESVSVKSDVTEVVPSATSMEWREPVKEHPPIKEYVSNPQPVSIVEEPVFQDPRLADMPEPVTERNPRKTSLPQPGWETESEANQKQTTPEKIATPVVKKPVLPAKKYMYPPISLLKEGPKKMSGDSSKELKDTALKLQQTLQTFGVKVKVTDISQGPAVTRFELQPEVGVKVSKIVGLADDIKLNLAATDIRIEAPIPGKAAVGIEVPNKENSMVAFRELIESKAYKDFGGKLVFGVGKDIGGQVVVTDIAKMPHMLIAGSTGSGKSVCINTIIMSILYKAHPDEVKLIMIDPKVVELSVYNGIPHLLLPVVTDPKKAAGALHWGVAEMSDRYNKFAEMKVRDLKGYNQKVEAMQKNGEPEAPNKLPQIVIIVDELADLMMVAPGEVEESICRLAQLARAAGIHMIIATQRPSVDVITGLIKANMPSRIAFAVSSGVDSRTILDMNGAEKLLGKGDMLFAPQGYPKPARIQGAFVSDGEVQAVVDFLKDQNVICNYNPDIEGAMKNSGAVAGMGTGSASEAASGVDEYFVEAGRFIIDKDKASIGMLQRVFKIGFNRAARIMDQLCEAGVVGEEEGTKPRKVLMSLEQFENYIEEM